MTSSSRSVTKVLAVTINSFSHAVGIKHHEISRTAGQRVLFIFRLFKQPQRQPRDLHRGRFSVAYANGVGQSGIRNAEQAFAFVPSGVDQGDVPSSNRALQKSLVQPGQHFGGTKLQRRKRTKDTGYQSCVDGRGCSLAANIADGLGADGLTGIAEKIVEISADDPSGHASRSEIDPGLRRVQCGQQFGLQFTRKQELAMILRIP